MSLNLSLHTAPEVPMEAEVVTPDRLQGLTEAEVAALPIHHGNENVAVGDFFTVSGKCEGEIKLTGDLSLVKHIGAGMSQGKIFIEGNVGQHLGSGMRGGEIVVEGNAHDWVGPEMLDGRIIIRGNGGHMVGSAYRGAAVGMRGGEIIVYGNVGNEAGNAMRGGLIAVAGNSGDFTGVNMRAGTIIVVGEMGIRNGAGMVRGTIVSMQRAKVLPTFSYECLYRPQFLRFYLIHLQKLGFPIAEAHVDGLYDRWSGDAVELNKGELLLFNN